MKSKLELVPRLLRTKQAAQYLSVSPWTLRKLAQDGKLPLIAEGAWRFDRVDLDKYVEQNKINL
jgi:excisionase family DNA binding protein